jgi:hypothetical protein
VWRRSAAFVTQLHDVVATLPQIPTLPSSLSGAFRRLLQSLVLSEASRRPSVVEAWRRIACLCFGPAISDDADAVGWDEPRCSTWLQSARIHMLHICDVMVRLFIAVVV